MAKPGRPTKTRRTGRPRIDINWDEFDKLCALQCTEAEIAAWFHCSIPTLWRRVKKEFGDTFENIYAQKRQAGFTSLRRKQFQRMQDGSDTMLVWLGKQYLGQKDKQESSSETKGVVQIVVTHDYKDKANGEDERSAPEAE